ncbi:hypothetical protein EV361DRAFT_943319 [Lentinula raphanica]|nr:hypothetical protein EV361DRAFT_943319 [Lentinula raphanica]
MSAVSDLEPHKTLLFCVSVDLLTTHSPVLEGILNIPADTTRVPEGTESNPIKLHGVSAESFHSLLAYLECRTSWEEFIETKENIVDLLKIGSRFEMDAVLNFAIKAVPKLDFDPVQLLALARQHHVRPAVREWIKPAVEALMFRRLNDLTIEDDLALGTAYPIIARTREKLDTLRKALAARPYSLVCGNNTMNHLQDCVRSWNFYWYQSISPRLIHPTHPLLGWGQLIQLVESANIPYVKQSCKDATLAEMRFLNDFPRSFEYIDQAVGAIIRVFDIYAVNAS